MSLGEQQPDVDEDPSDPFLDPLAFPRFLSGMGAAVEVVLMGPGEGLEQERVHRVTS